MKNINFLLSSITFLSYFLPLVIECNKNNIQVIFYIRANKKNYANPKSKINSKILNKYIKRYKIQISSDNIIKDGPIICIDGDIYGPYKNDKLSLIYKNNNNNKIISLQENLNFIWNYDYYKDKVDFIIFPNESYAKLYNKISNNNVYIGNTKYDYVLSSQEIYAKYKLNPKNKYALVLFPKQKFIKSYNIKSEHLLRIYNYLHIMGFKIIVKSRPKDAILLNCKGDLLIISDTFPNESLELMKISDRYLILSERHVVAELPGDSTQDSLISALSKTVCALRQL